MAVFGVAIGYIIAKDWVDIITIVAIFVFVGIPLAYAMPWEGYYDKDGKLQPPVG